MSLVKILDFCAALNVKEGTVRSKISRGQIICNEKRLIDTEDPINFKYIVEINSGDQSVFEKHCVKNIANVVKKVSSANKTSQKIAVTKKVGVKPAAKTVKKTAEKPKISPIKKVNKIKGSVKVAPAVETKKTTAKKVVNQEPKLSEEELFEIQLKKQQNQTYLEIDIAKKKADLDNVIRSAEIKRMQLEKIMGNTIPLDLGMTIWAINIKSVYKSLHSQLKNMASTYVEILGGSKDDLNKIMKEMEIHLNSAKNFAQENAKREIDSLVEEYSEVRSRGERKL
ncbi:hypothetical protein [Flavobacterium phage FL-1]|nr:hypothetical protein [Flavobacterium phage FL-1]